jgi:2-polyprenyl-3-methyl-5-hydroxy-6-metoxy-1,4-benzoquinol methylase
MPEERGYQFGFSDSSPSMHDRKSRVQKAETMIAVLGDYFDIPLKELRVLDVGASTGIIDDHLAAHFHSVLGIDIDQEAIQFAQNTFSRDNLVFREGDALATNLSDDSVDVVICSHVYEHVPDAYAMMDEIFRVLRPRGICYFSAGNRLTWKEPHYHLPLLSAIPRPLAHLYIRMTGKASHYHELHFSYWGLRKLVRRFERVDYTHKLIAEPDRYHTADMIRSGTSKHAIAKLVVKLAYWLVPGYIWLLRKPGDFGTRSNGLDEVGEI